MRIAFLFSGQGTQYPGMMRDLADANDDVRKIFDTADNVLGRKISTLCFEGTQEELNLTHNTQPCVLAADLAVYAAVTALGVRPAAVAGFSLGEYAALVAAGVVPLEKVFPIVQKRADLMQDAVPIGDGAMAAVMKLTEAEVTALCAEVDGYIAPANYNCPGQIVVSGETKAIDQMLELAKARKIRAGKLLVSAPFHCKMMRPAADGLRPLLERLGMKAPAIPVYMNVDAMPETEPDKLLAKLVLQAMSPVRWEDTLRNMYADGIDTFVELGPGDTLSKFVEKTLKGEAKAFHVTDLETLNITIKALKE